MNQEHKRLWERERYLWSQLQVARSRGDQTAYGQTYDAYIAVQDKRYRLEAEVAKTEESRLGYSVKR